MAKTIQQLAEENSSFIPPRVYGFNFLWLRTEVENACKKTGNAVLEEIEKAISADAYHLKNEEVDVTVCSYPLFVNEQLITIIKELKGK